MTMTTTTTTPSSMPGGGAGPSTPPTSLLSALLSIRSTPPRIIQSPPTQPRRASVALVLRLKPPEGLVVKREEWGVGLGLDEFFRLPWVNHPSTTPQLLFIRRTTRPSDRYSSHIAFPGGRSEPSDKSSQYTALRETWEEIGVDLAEREFMWVGRLDDREITTSLGKRLLMVLSPFVFIQLTPHSPTPDLQPSEISSLHWIDLDQLTPPSPAPHSSSSSSSPSSTSLTSRAEESQDKRCWGTVEIDISSRLSPRNKLVRGLLRGLVGGMKFTSLLLPDEPSHVSSDYMPEFDDLMRDGAGTVLGKDGERKLRLWGLTLGMTLDLLSHLPGPEVTPLIVPRRLPSVDMSESTPLISNPRAQADGADEKQSPTTTHTLSKKIDEKTLRAPKTPVTVQSTFDDAFGGQGAEGESVGSRVDLKVLEGKEKGEGVEGARRLGNRRGVGPGITAVFPRFSYPDVNLFIWLFSRKYRRLIRQWEESTRGPPSAASRRVNWSGAALAAFYSAVRHALVLAIVVRALVATMAVGTVGWYTWRWVQVAMKGGAGGWL